MCEICQAPAQPPCPTPSHPLSPQRLYSVVQATFLPTLVLIFTSLYTSGKKKREHSKCLWIDMSQFAKKKFSTKKLQKSLKCATMVCCLTGAVDNECSLGSHAAKQDWKRAGARGGLRANFGLWHGIFLAGYIWREVVKRKRKFAEVQNILHLVSRLKTTQEIMVWLMRSHPRPRFAEEHICLQSNLGHQPVSFSDSQSQCQSGTDVTASPRCRDCRDCRRKASSTIWKRKRRDTKDKQTNTKQVVVFYI